MALPGDSRHMLCCLLSVYTIVVTGLTLRLSSIEKQEERYLERILESSLPPVFSRLRAFNLQLQALDSQRLIVKQIIDYVRDRGTQFGATVKYNMDERVYFICFDSNPGAIQLINTFRGDRFTISLLRTSTSLLANF